MKFLLKDLSGKTRTIDTDGDITWKQLLDKLKLSGLVRLKNKKFDKNEKVLNANLKETDTIYLMMCMCKNWMSNDHNH